MAAIQDNLTIIFALVVLAFGGLLVMVIIDAVDDAFQATTVDDLGKGVVSDFDTKIPRVIDFVVPLLFIGLPLIALGLAFTNFIPPVFYWVAALGSIVLSMVGFMVQDVWAEYTAPTVFSNVASTVPVTDFLFSNMGYYSVVVWLVIALGTYAKTQGVGGGGF